jgi:hypothetical protein
MKGGEWNSHGHKPIQAIEMRINHLLRKIKKHNIFLSLESEDINFMTQLCYSLLTFM